MRVLMALIFVASSSLAGEDYPDDLPPPAPPVEDATAPEPAATETTAPSPAPAAAAPRAYALDADRSQIYALLYKKGVASAVAHDHVVEARDVRGAATLALDDPAASSIEVTVSVSGLFPDDPTLRKNVGLPDSVSDRQRSEILDHIRSEAQLFLARYDTIAFRSTAVRRSGDAYTVSGDFTLRGVTKRVSVPMTLTSEGDGVRARGRFRILQSDYGYAAYRALLGAIQNEDHVDVVIDVHLAPR